MAVRIRRTASRLLISFWHCCVESKRGRIRRVGTIHRVKAVVLIAAGLALRSFAQEEQDASKKSISPDGKWEFVDGDQPKIVKAGANEVALDLEGFGGVLWAPDSKSPCCCGVSRTTSSNASVAVRDFNSAFSLSNLRRQQLIRRAIDVSFASVFGRVTFVGAALAVASAVTPLFSIGETRLPSNYEP
jgi:hypothetical protein